MLKDWFLSKLSISYNILNIKNQFSLLYNNTKIDTIMYN
jgi:hypothetical protein